MPTKSTLIIGSGRVATHIGRYFGLKHIAFETWNRREHTEGDLREKLGRASLVLLLIKDGAIAEFFDRHLNAFRGTVVHFSGTLEHSQIKGFHPLMTFGPETYDLPFYERIPFAASSEADFRHLFPKLINPVFELKGDKALYHALCVMSGNFPQILWNECLTRFAELGVPTEAVGLYLQKNLENFMAAPGRALTGPLARRDKATIQKNIDALPQNMAELYRAFVKFFTEKD